MEPPPAYVEAKSAFRNAILAAQRDGVDNAEIARCTGFSVSMIVAVLRAS